MGQNEFTGALEDFTSAQDKLVQERFLQGLSAFVPPKTEAEEGRGGPHEAKPRIVDAMVSFEELLRLDMPERKQHLAWLKEGSLVMVFGPRGIGKTMLQLGLTAGLVTGSKFLAWEVSAPVGVLYIDGEMPLDELRHRTTALLSNPPKAPLHFLTSEVVYAKTQRDLTLTSTAIQDEITTMLDAHPDIRVVILDNISSLFVGIDEDRKRDWEPISAWLVRLRHRGLSVILVHHAGKGGNQRGTSGREDALDVVIQLDRPSQYDAREGCHFELRFTKARSVKGDDVTPLDIRLTEEAGLVQLLCKPLEESREDQVGRLLDAGLTSPTDVAAELDISKGYACKLIQKVKRITCAGGA
jgi:putative DNA primase/helicase